MKFRVDVVKTNEAGEEISRTTAGEYEFEFEAIAALQEEDQKLKASGENAHMDLRMIEEEGDRLYHEEPKEVEDKKEIDYTPEDYLDFEYERVGGDNWRTINFTVGDDSMQDVAREENQKWLLDMIEESDFHKLVSMYPSTEEEIKKELSRTYENYMPMKLSKKLDPLAMRWAYDGGGIACGPVDGSYITEIMFHDEEGRPYFVSMSRMSEFMNVYVSEVSLFDLQLWFGNRYANSEDYMQKIEKYASIEFNTELGEYDEILESEYKDEMILVIAMNNYFVHHDSENPDPEEMLGVFRSKQFFVGLPMGWSWDDEEEEDEG